MRFEYILDDAVTPALDAKLRHLLSTCFTKEQDKIFQTQRYFREMPRHRYLIWDGEILAAHIAVHEKQVMIDDQSFPISGITEVCVQPNFSRERTGENIAQFGASGCYRARRCLFHIIWANARLSVQRLSADR